MLRSHFWWQSPLAAADGNGGHVSVPSPGQIKTTPGPNSYPVGNDDSLVLYPPPLVSFRAPAYVPFSLSFSFSLPHLSLINICHAPFATSLISLTPLASMSTAIIPLFCLWCWTDCERLMPSEDVLEGPPPSPSPSPFSSLLSCNQFLPQSPVHHTLQLITTSPWVAVTTVVNWKVESI